MYHMITPHKPGTKFNGLRVTPERFEQQVKWLHDEGWHFLTMSELMTPEATLPEKTVAITFDDGYEDNCLNAWPILKKYQAKATLYLVVDRHNNDWSTNKKAHHNSGELVREPKLSDAQVTEMVQSGVFELGGHTVSHINLATADVAKKEAEISGCKTSLEQQYHTTVTSFAYPFGIHTPEDEQLVESAGFTHAVLAEGGIETCRYSRPFLLRRVKISGKDSFLAFLCRIRTGQRGWKK